MLEEGIFPSITILRRSKGQFINYGIGAGKHGVLKNNKNNKNKTILDLS